MLITAVQALATKTSTFDGSSIDISSATTFKDWTLVVEVQNLVGTARFAFEDSVDAFSNNIVGPTISLTGAIVKSESKRFTFRSYDFPSMRFGTASAVLRLSLTQITGSSATVTYQAWIES